MLGPRLCFAWSLSREQARGAQHDVLWQCVALAMQCKNRLGLNFELRSARTSNYECWTADCGPKWPRRLCVCRCAPSWCGTSRYDATELKSFERPLVELVTYPLSAPKVLVASKILQPLQGWAGELHKHPSHRTHSRIHAKAAPQSDASL